MILVFWLPWFVEIIFWDNYILPTCGLGWIHFTKMWFEPKISFPISLLVHQVYVLWVYFFIFLIGFCSVSMRKIHVGLIKVCVFWTYSWLCCGQCVGECPLIVTILLSFPSCSSNVQSSIHLFLLLVSLPLQAWSPPQISYGKRLLVLLISSPPQDTSQPPS